jgi:DNA polymerase-1
MKEPVKKLILLDAHAILHRAYHALPDFVSSKGEPTGGLYGLSTMLIKIIADLKPDYIVACYDLPGPTYRHEVYKDYKAGRKKADSELVSQMKRSRDVFAAFNIPLYDKPGFEADDMLGTIVEEAKNPKKIGGAVDIVIASGDMDTLQLVSDKKVQVYTLKKGINDTILYDEEAVRARFGFGPELLPDYKGLRGDPSDNIIGIAGIGEKTATILITTFGTIENMYKVLEKESVKGAYASFKKAGLTDRVIELLKEGKEEAEFSKMLATIRRDAPINFVLPQQEFRAGLDKAQLGALFTELDFRTLMPRLNNVLEGKSMTGTAGAKKGKKDEKTGEENGGENSEEKKGEKEKATEKIAEKIDPDDFKKTAIALWLVKSDLTDPTIDDMYAFAGVENFEQAKTAIFGELEKRGLKKVYEDIELPLIPVIEKMEKYGVKIDVDYLRTLGVEYHTQAHELEKKIWAIAGVEFNINSPKQLGDILFDKLGLKIKNAKKTGGGARSTKESELQKLAETEEAEGKTSIAKLILEYRELQKLLGTYIDTIPTQVDADNRLHTTLLQTGATTGRMSSKNPNLQNIPIKTELGKRIRHAFVADAAAGFILASFDYSQIELRVAAFLSGDAKMIEIFKNGGDVHKAVAAAVFGVPEEKVDYEMRRRAKVINFGVMYGMGVNALRANLGTDRAEAQRFYNDYFTTFSGLAAYIDRVKAEAARNGFTETFFGRRRYFEGIKSKLPFIRAMAERMAVNAPIQGTEADIIKLAMIRIDEYISSEGLSNDVRMLLQVHDELLFEIRKNSVGEKNTERIAEKIKSIMEGVIDPTKTSGVKCVAEYAMGSNWGEL